MGPGTCGAANRYHEAEWNGQERFCGTTARLLPVCSGSSLGPHHEYKMKQDHPDQCTATGKRLGRRPVNTGLLVSPLTFGEDALRGLIDDWIVPALVEQFLVGKKALPDPTKEEHN